MNRTETLSKQKLLEGSIIDVNYYCQNPSINRINTPSENYKGILVCFAFFCASIVISFFYYLVFLKQKSANDFMEK